jgi:hypothetical protein
MYGSDLSHAISLPLGGDLDHGLMTMPAEVNEERVQLLPALHTPPLRYDVASLEHWLDLNA